MAQKSYMNWQTAFCLAAFITLIFVLPVFSPLYLKMMVRLCRLCTQICVFALQYRELLPPYIFALRIRFSIVEGEICSNGAELVFYGRSAPDNAAIQLFTVAVI